jgi:Mg2+-importing ATPase
MAIGIAIPYISPIGHALGLVHPAKSFIGFLAAELLLYCLEVQLVKMIYIWVFKTWL